MRSFSFAAGAKAAVVIGALVGLGSWRSESKAAVLSFSVSESPSLADFSDREVKVPQFDTSLGVLQSVTIDVRGTGAFQQGLQRRGASDRALVGLENLNLVLETQDGHNLVTLNQSPTQIASGLGVYRGVFGNLTSSFVHRVDAFGETTLTSGDESRQFMGDDFVDLLLSAREAPGDWRANKTGLLGGLWMVGANITVDYNYAAVPETSTWLAGGFAVLILAFSVHSRLRRSG